MRGLKVYVVHVTSSDYLRHKSTGGPFNRSDYYANPGEYESHFHETVRVNLAYLMTMLSVLPFQVAPYTTVLINGAGWSLGFPRILPTEVLPRTIQLARNVGLSRFRTIADISCDISGGIEFVNRSCTIDEPFFYCGADGMERATPTADGVQVMSIDILPSELPLDASKHFSKAFRPYLGALIRMYQGKAVNEEGLAALDVVDRATIARNGQLLPKHTWLNELLATHGAGTTLTTPAADTDKLDLDLASDLGGMDSSSSLGAGAFKKKRVLLLGSGMVAKPAVDEFLSRRDIELVVGTCKLWLHPQRLSLIRAIS